MGQRELGKGGGEKGSEWGNKEIRRVVGRKKVCFLIWRRTRREEDLNEYRRMKRVFKRMVREVKKEE